MGILLESHGETAPEVPGGGCGHPSRGSPRRRAGTRCRRRTARGPGTWPGCTRGPAQQSGSGRPPEFAPCRSWTPPRQCTRCHRRPALHARSSSGPHVLTPLAPPARSMSGAQTPLVPPVRSLSGPQLLTPLALPARTSLGAQLLTSRSPCPHRGTQSSSDIPTGPSHVRPCKRSLRRGTGSGRRTGRASCRWMCCP